MPRSREEKNAYIREWRRRRKEKGLCQDCGAPAKGRVFCQDCVDKNRAEKNRRLREHRQRRKEKGLCVECGVSTGGKRLCQDCSARYKGVRVSRLEHKKENGICFECPAKALPGKRMCEKHAKIANRKSNNIREKRIKEGKCPSCGGPPDIGPMGGTQSCAACVKRQIRSMYAQQRRRREAGLCPTCGAKPPKGRTTCKACGDKKNKQVRRLRRGRVDKGLCAMCGAPAIEGITFCEKHLRKPSIYKAPLIRKLGAVCSGCGRKKTANQLEVDHLIPIAKGGEDTAENCCNLLCKPCNLLKRARLMTMDELREENKKLGRLPKAPKFPKAQGDDLVSKARA